MSRLEMICDLTNQKIEEVPQNVLSMTYLRMLYLENNLVQSLPDNFFPSLPELSWLDLRNNRLCSLPKNVGEHKRLENLLLQNNLLTQLPDELGLLTTLKVLQLSGNQILYPPASVQKLGVSNVVTFLRDQYYFKANAELNENPKSTSKAVVKPGKSKDALRVKELLRGLSSNSPFIKSQLPAIDVKSLSKPESAVNEDDDVDAAKSKKVHKVTKTCSKLSVQSHYSNKFLEKKVRNKEIRINPQDLKDMWLSKMRDLIQDQQKILQQEKNLTALSDWRLDKKLKPLVNPNYTKPLPPYDVSAEFERMLSRKDLSEPIQKLIRQRTPVGGTKIDFEAFISEVIAQLNKVEKEQHDSPKSSLKCSEEDIKTILDLHKQISSLKLLNDKY